MRSALNKYWIRLKGQVTGLCLIRIGFWSDGLFRFSSNAVALSIGADSDQQAKFITILSRECYFETVREYPIGRQSDLKKILAAEQVPGPHQGPRFDKLVRTSDSSFSVTSWVVKQSVVAALPNRPWLLVPETACLNANGHGGEVLANRLGKSLTIRSGPDGIKSALTAGSADSAGAPNNLGLYTQAPLLASQDGNRHIAEEQFPSELLRGLKQILWASPLLFILPPDRSAIRQYPWVRAAKLSSFIFAGYIAVSSVYLHGMQLFTDYRIDRVLEGSQIAVALQKETAVLKSSILELNQSLANTEPNWIVWDLAIGLVEDGVIFTAINNTNGRIKFHGSAQKASVILSKLVDDPRVVSADYASAVLNRRGKETFVIEFELNPEIQATTPQVGLASDPTESSLVADEK
jgi:hypothetical protein